MKNCLLYPALLLSLAATAQVKPVATKPVTTSTPKWKPPVVKTTLGKYSGTANTCVAEEAKQLVTLPLRIADTKNNTYSVYSYQVAYKRMGVTENEETGDLTPASHLVAQRFSETPITGIWRSSLVEQLKKGDELLFFDIIVSDGKDHKFFAPDVKITVE